MHIGFIKNAEIEHDLESLFPRDIHVDYYQASEDGSLLFRGRQVSISALGRHDVILNGLSSSSSGGKHISHALSWANISSVTSDSYFARITSSLNAVRKYIPELEDHIVEYLSEPLETKRIEHLRDHLKENIEYPFALRSDEKFVFHVDSGETLNEASRKNWGKELYLEEPAERGYIEVLCIRDFRGEELYMSLPMAHTSLGWRVVHLSECEQDDLKYIKNAFSGRFPRQDIFSLQLARKKHAGLKISHIDSNPLSLEWEIWSEHSEAIGSSWGVVLEHLISLAFARK